MTPMERKKRFTRRCVLICVVIAIACTIYLGYGWVYSIYIGKITQTDFKDEGPPLITLSETMKQPSPDTIKDILGCDLMLQVTSNEMWSYTLSDSECVLMFSLVRNVEPNRVEEVINSNYDNLGGKLENIKLEQPSQFSPLYEYSTSFGNVIMNGYLYDKSQNILYNFTFSGEREEYNAYRDKVLKLVEEFKFG